MLAHTNGELFALARKNEEVVSSSYQPIKNAHCNQCSGRFGYSKPKARRLLRADDVVKRTQ